MSTHATRTTTWAVALTLAALTLTACAPPLPRSVRAISEETSPGPVEVLDENYIDPDTPPVTTGPTSPEAQETTRTLPDPGAADLSRADEAAAIETAVTFLETVWTWDSTDSTDRAGLQRALPLATDGLATQLQHWIDHPIYSSDEWEALAGRADVGSTIAILRAGPAPEGTFDHETYTAQIIFRTYIAGPTGAPMPTGDEARYATLTLARTPEDTWQVADLPLQDLEHVIDPGDDY